MLHVIDLAEVISGKLHDVINFVTEFSILCKLFSVNLNYHILNFIEERARFGLEYIVLLYFW